MSFTNKFIQCDFTMAQGVFQGGGNSYSAKRLRTRATIVKAGGLSLGAANVEIYGLPLSIMNQLSTFGIALTMEGRNHITISAGEDPDNLATVFTGDIWTAYFDGSHQPDVAFCIEAQVGAYHALKPIPPTSQPGSQDVATLMGQIAGQMGLQFENNNVSTKLMNPYLPGTAIQQMHACAEHAGIEHVVDCGTLAIWNPGDARQGDTVLISPQTGLVGYPLFNSQGIIFRTLFQPTLTYGQKVHVQSSITGACGEEWRVYKLTYDLAAMTPKGPWFQDVWASPPNQTPVA